MKNNFKRITAVILTLIMCVSVVMPVFAVENSKVCPGLGKLHTAANCSWTEVGKTEPTCLESGSVTARCDTCSTRFVASTTDAHGHEYVLHEGNCTTPVTKVCKYCDDTFSISNAPGHKWTEWTIAGGKCERGAAIERKCSVCNFEEKSVMRDDHNWEISETTAPVDCQHPGVVKYVCTSVDCDETKSEEIWIKENQYHIFENLIDIDGDGIADNVLSIEISSVDKRLVSKNMAPTCFRNGQQAQICVVCGETKIVIIEKIEHDFVKPESVENANDDLDGVNALPTCTTPGQKAYLECKYCHQYKYNKTPWSYSTEINPILGSYEGSIADEENIGITSNKSNLVIPAMHNWYISNNSLENNCTMDGQNIIYCENPECAYNKSEQIVSTTATGHKFYCDLSDEEKELFINNKIIISEVVEATCLTDAYVEYGCLNCYGTSKETYGSVKKVITTKKVTHVANENYDPSQSMAETCTTPGRLVYTCKWCSVVMSSATITVPAKGHKLDKPIYVVDGACKETGKGYYICSNEENGVTNCFGEVIECNYNINFDPTPDSPRLVELPKKEHTWIKFDGSPIVPLTCSSTSEKVEYYRVCAVCDYSSANGGKYVEFRPAHKFAEVTKENIEAGLVVEETKGTCEVAARYIRYCEGVGCSEYIVEVDSTTYGTGHVKVVLNSKVLPTCNTVGREEIWRCTVAGCDKNVTEGVGGEVINALHHNANGIAYSWSDVYSLLYKNDLTQYMTYTDGNYGSQAYGANIVVINKDDKSETPALVKELKITDTLTWVFYVPETCTTNDVWGGFVCSACNSADHEGTLYDIPYVVADTETEPQHDLVYYGSAVDRTCTTHGYSPRKCESCDAVFQVNYVEPSHNYAYAADGTPIKTQEIYPTCELSGSYMQSCIDCGFIKTTFIPELGHYNSAGFKLTTSCLDRAVDRKCATCVTVITKGHHFGEWALSLTDSTKEVRACKDCGLEETRNAPETEAPETSAPIETLPPETSSTDTTEGTDTSDISVSTDEPTSDTEDKIQDPDGKGCGGTITVSGLAIVAALLCGSAVAASKKREDD